VVACLLFGGLVGGLVWALSTQARWVQENKPLVVKPPTDAEASEPKQVPAETTGVVGTVSQDTRDSMAKELEARRQARKPRKQAPSSRAFTGSQL